MPQLLLHEVFMPIMLISALVFFLTSTAFAYSTLDCTSNNHLTYSSHFKVGGARPFPGMVTHVEEINKDNQVIYRKVQREDCDSRDYCQLQRPELNDIDLPDVTFHFIPESKHVLATEGQVGEAITKETYAVKFLFEEEVWMLCQSYSALYP